MSDYISDLYPAALDSGMIDSEFWESSLREIIDRIESADRKRKYEIGNLFMFSEVISNRMFRDKDTPVLMPWDYYPQLFAADKVKYEEKKQAEELESYKEKRRMAMDRHNARRSGKEVIE